MKSTEHHSTDPTPASIQSQTSVVKTAGSKLNESVDAAPNDWLPGFDPALDVQVEEPNEAEEQSLPASNGASDSEPIAASAIGVTSLIHVPRVSVVSVTRQRISGAQPITDAVETLCCSAYVVWMELAKQACPLIGPIQEGAEVDYLLVSVGRSELS